MRLAVIAASAVLMTWYVGLSIRHIWQGAVLDGELYSYTLAMLVASAGVLMLAFAIRHAPLRTLAMVGVGLTIAEAFIVDMSDLTGLIRVVSFLGLGLSLIALTWLNRVMDVQWVKPDADEPH